MSFLRERLSTRDSIHANADADIEVNRGGRHHDPTERAVPGGELGRWVGGTSLVIGPLLVLAGVLTRLPVHFFFPAQLSAYQQHPLKMSVAAGLTAAGWLLLWPGVVLLALRIGRRHRELGAWAGVLAVLGLFTRTFHAGIDHADFRLVHAQGAEAATRTVSETYGMFHIFTALGAAILFGWLLLAVGAYRARVLGLVPALALAATAAMPLGVLKGTSPWSVVAGVGLCVALVPLGISTWRTGPRPRPSALITRVAAVLAVAVVMAVIGQLG